VTLADGVRAELHRRTRAATSEQRAVRRARIILACEGQHTADEVGREVGVHPSTVERWRTRFLREGLTGLEDRPRPGRAPKFTPVQRLEIVARACEPIVVPGASPKDGKTTRTIDDLLNEVIRQAIVTDISWSSVQRILAGLDVKPHKTEMWLHSPDPEFREKVTAICDLYLKLPPAGSVVLSIDEKPGMQALARRFPDRAPASGRRPRREFEYKRHGTQTLIAAFEVHTGRVITHCGDKRTAEDLVGFMEEIAAQYPNQIVHVIWDNLNIHYDGKDERWTKFNERHGARFVFHYTPKHASWVNQIECFFSILQRTCLANGSFHSTTELRTAVLAFIDYWNREKAHPFRWTFTGYPLQTGVELDMAA
jgi:transposase